MGSLKIFHAAGWVGLAVLAAAATAAPAGAQQTVVSAPDAIRACLCLQQSVNSRATELAARNRAYDERRRQAAALDSEVATRKPQVNVNDRNSIEAFSNLLGRRDAAVQGLADMTPQYSAFVASYNQLVDRYNRQCSGQSLDANVMAQVKQNLVCTQE